jgi:hypothetical protein
VRRAPFVRDSDGGVAVDGEGFYIPITRLCERTPGARHELAFTDHAQPYGVTLRLSCTTSECDEL